MPPHTEMALVLKRTGLMSRKEGYLPRRKKKWHLKLIAGNISFIYHWYILTFNFCSPCLWKIQLGLQEVSRQQAPTIKIKLGSLISYSGYLSALRLLISYEPVGVSNIQNSLLNHYHLSEWDSYLVSQWLWATSARFANKTEAIYQPILLG